MTTQEINENEYSVVYHSCSKSTDEYPEQQGMNKEQGDEENNNNKKKSIPEGVSLALQTVPFFSSSPFAPQLVLLSFSPLPSSHYFSFLKLSNFFLQTPFSASLAPILFFFWVKPHLPPNTLTSQFPWISRLTLLICLQALMLFLFKQASTDSLLLLRPSFFSILFQSSPLLATPATPMLQRKGLIYPVPMRGGKKKRKSPLRGLQICHAF